MASNPQRHLLVFSALAMLITLQGCNGFVATLPDDHEFPDAPPTDQASPTVQTVEVVATATSTEAPPEWGDSVTWAASDPNAESGLVLSLGGDFDVEAVRAGPQQLAAYRTGNRAILPSADGNYIQDSYMQFQVDDAFLYGGMPTPHIRIEIEYLDVGNDMFFIEYDGEIGGPFDDGRFADTSYQTKANSGEVRTAVFWMHDAHFANRDYGGDFRINDTSDGAETILRVTVTRFMPDMDPASHIAVDFYSDGDQLTIGQCTMLHWVVQNATDVTLDNNSVDHRDQEFICPPSTQTYTLLASNTAGQVQKELTIAVFQAAAESLPTYDLAASCWNSFNCWTEAECRFFRVLSAQGSSGISYPIEIALYVGGPWSLSLVQSVNVNPLGPGQGVTLYYGGPVQCCQIILRNNHDLDPGNDSYRSCK